ncbi:MAG TPA: enoyl-CoA hydratase-related protein [Thermodesulfobacteriota bacterium]|nr:enoyl-CoA hydratase-related protein [Thermodesulfobacteriota bacterium]
MTESVKLREENGMAVVLLNRPEAFNAFDQEMVTLLAKTLTRIAMDDSVSAVVISGEGKAFCAGGDLRALLALPRGPAAGLYELAATFHQAIVEIRRMKKPVIAAINGIAAGGGFSMALACDFRVMAQSAVLRQAYTSNGLSVDGGGTFTLPRMVGLARALEIIAFDKPISSDQALAWGLATKVVPDGQSLGEALRLVLDLKKVSLHSFGRCKELMTNSFNTAFETQMELERAALSCCADHADGQEGLKAFAEKRKPVFGGKGS